MDGSLDYVGLAPFYRELVVGRPFELESYFVFERVLGRTLWVESLASRVVAGEQNSPLLHSRGFGMGSSDALDWSLGLG